MCPSLISGPTWVSGSSGSPSTILPVRASSFSTKASFTDSCTNTRVPLVHTWPWV